MSFYAKLSLLRKNLLISDCSSLLRRYNKPRATFFLLMLFFSTRAFALTSWSSGDFYFSLNGFLKNQTILMRFYDSPLWTTQFYSSGLDRIRISTETGWQFYTVHVEYEGRLQYHTNDPGAFFSIEGFSYDTSLKSGNRLFELDDFHSGDVVWENDLDRLYIRVPIGPADLTVGRQAITWSTAWFWRPIDRFCPFSPFEVYPDVKRGVDAIRLETYLSDVTKLDVIGQFASTSRINYGARLTTNVADWDVAVAFARFQEELSSALQLAGQWGKIGLRAEFVFNYYTDSSKVEPELVASGDVRLTSKAIVAIELFYNGYGTTNTDDYITYFYNPSNPQKPPQKGEKLQSGELFNIGKYYAAYALQYQLHPLLRLQLAQIFNLLDTSWLLSANVTLSAADDVIIVAGAMIAYGDRPESNLLSATFKSEFGIYPDIYYVLIKYSF